MLLEWRFGMSASHDEKTVDRFKMVDNSLVSKGNYGANPKVVKEALAQLERNPGKTIYIALTEFKTKNRGTIRSAFFRQNPDISTFFEDGFIAVRTKEK